MVYKVCMQVQSESDGDGVFGYMMNLLLSAACTTLSFAKLHQRYTLRYTLRYTSPFRPPIKRKTVSTKNDGPRPNVLLRLHFVLSSWNLITMYTQITPTVMPLAMSDPSPSPDRSRRYLHSPKTPCIQLQRSLR